MMFNDVMTDEDLLLAVKTLSNLKVCQLRSGVKVPTDRGIIDIRFSYKPHPTEKTNDQSTHHPL